MEKSKSIEAGMHLMVGTEYTEDKQKDDGAEPKKSICAKIKFFVTNITVEPVMICYILPSVMSSIATQNLSLEKACRVNLRLGDKVCDALTIRNESAYPNYKRDEELVQTLGAEMAIWKNIIQSIIPSCLLLFLGSWSDRHQKRKPCILNPVLGDIFMCLGFLTCTYFFYELPIEFNTVAEALPPALTGGWFAMFMGTFSYISGISTEKQRTLRIGAVNMFVNVSVCVGIALSGILFEKIGFYGVYSLALVIYVSGYLYGLICIKDSYEINREKLAAEGVPVVKEVSNEKKVGFIKDFFDIRHIAETFRVAFKSGKNNRRMRVCLIMVLVMVIIGPMHGEINVVYFFVRYKFDWNSIDYSIFSTFQFVTNMIGTLFSLMFFTKFLKLDDSLLGIISCSSKVLASVVYAFAPTPLILYVAAVVEILNGTAFIAMRSMVSKLVPAEELGKINSLFGLAEAIVPLVYGPLYSKIYANTMEYFPGAFYLAGGGLTVPALFIFFWLYLQQKKDKEEAEEIKQQEEKLLKENENLKKIRANSF